MNRSSWYNGIMEKNDFAHDYVEANNFSKNKE